MVKNFLLDTNILLANPEAIFGFDDNNVYVCGTTLQELDSKKKAPGELGYNARWAIRILDELREKGDLIKGVEIGNGHFKVEPDGVKAEYLPEGFSISVPDNRIISTCIHMNETYLRDNNVILLTNDISMRVNASVCGVKVQGVRNDVVEDKGYTGMSEAEVFSDVISSLYEVGSITTESFINKSFMENEFVTLSCGSQSVLTVHRHGMLELVKAPEAIGNISPLNSAQTYAMWALAQPDIPLVILEGPAGTSKTFLSLAMGLTQTKIDEQDTDAIYNKMMIARPNTGSSDKDFGYLPGDLQEKMSPLISNFTDNLAIILRGKGEKVPEVEVRNHIDDMMKQGVVELCPLYGIRGRSVQKGFLICDEAQNASKLLIRDVITRAGKGTKIVIAGDSNQVDNPTLDSKNNGLVYAVDKMAGSPLCAVVKFGEKNCVRSKLAEEAVRRMQ